MTNSSTINTILQSTDFQQPLKSKKNSRIIDSSKLPIFVKSSTSTKPSKLLKPCYISSTKITLAILLIFYSSTTLGARLSTRNGVDTINSLDNPENLLFLNSYSLNKIKQICGNIYRNQNPRLIKSASFASRSKTGASKSSTLEPYSKLIMKRTVNVNLKWGKQRYKCDFIYYDGCESRCKKVDQCLLDQGLDLGYSTCQDKKKKEDRNGKDIQSRYTRRVLHHKVRPRGRN